MRFVVFASVFGLTLAAACGGNVSIGSIASDAGAGDGGPELCSADACGPAPAIARQCPDGTSQGMVCMKRDGKCVLDYPPCPVKDGGAEAGDPCAGKTLPTCPRACKAFPETGACAVGDSCGNEIGDTCTCTTGKWECQVHPPLGTGCNKVCQAAPACFDDQGALLAGYRKCATEADCASVRITTDCCGNVLVTGVRAVSLKAADACGQARAAGFPKCGCPTGPARSDAGNSEVTPGATPIVQCIPDGTGVSVCQTKF